MFYVACEVVSGTAYVAAPDELVAWVGQGKIGEYIPYGLFEPVGVHLDTVLGL